MVGVAWPGMRRRIGRNWPEDVGVGGKSQGDRDGCEEGWRVGLDLSWAWGHRRTGARRTAKVFHHAHTWLEGRQAQGLVLRPQVEGLDGVALLHQPGDAEGAEGGEGSLGCQGLLSLLRCHRGGGGGHSVSTDCVPKSALVVLMLTHKEDDEFVRVVRPLGTHLPRAGGGEGGGVVDEVGLQGRECPLDPDPAGHGDADQTLGAHKGLDLT